jgi:hypothetical protein
MRHSSLLPTAALASALLLGCSDQPGGTDPNPDATPSLKAEISRFETPLIISFASGDPDIAALVGVSLEHFPALCAGAEPEAVAETMIVTHPSRQGGTSAHVLTKGTEVPALVWPVDIGPGGDVCDLTVQPFVGTVNVTINDNEGEFFETAPGANAFFIRFVGTVTDTETGQRYHLQGAIQIVVLPDGTFTFPPVPFLSLTPIGG